MIGEDGEMIRPVGDFPCGSLGCVLSFLQYFDTVGLVTGRASGLLENLCQSYTKRFSPGTNGE